MSLERSMSLGHLQSYKVVQEFLRSDPEAVQDRQVGCVGSTLYRCEDTEEKKLKQLTE